MPRRILSIWCANLAIDRWQLAEGASPAPFALLAETAHGPRIAALNRAAREAGVRAARDAEDAWKRTAESIENSLTDALLRGLLYAPSGERMYPTYSRKNGRKYHYYVSKSEARFGAPGKGYERLPAPEIEGAVVAQIRTVLTSPETVASVVRHIQRNGAQIDEATTVMAMGRLNNVWDQLFPVERHRIANLMIERIDLVHAGEVQGIKVKWREVGWNALIDRKSVV